MINRQRKRAETIIRCHKNVRMLHLIISESKKIKKIEAELSVVQHPELITYLKDTLYIADGITKKQAIKIQYNFLIEQMQKAKIAFEDYYAQLNTLLEKVSIDVLND